MHNDFRNQSYVQREGSGASLFVDEAALLKIIVHFYRFFNVPRYRKRVDVTEFREK
jgi:hypothetical protein